MFEKTLESNIEAHHLVIEFKAAYDSEKRTVLYQSILEFGIPEKLVQLTTIEI